jgi:RNA polymerase sigma-70 factor (ECF subfamily)
MELKTADIWQEHHSEIFFFVLKRVKNTDATNDIVQNTFLKVHTNLKTVKDVSKLKAWIFQIARNEIINFHNNNNKATDLAKIELDVFTQNSYNNLCCFDKFVNELSEKYRTVIVLVFWDGKKLLEVAQELDLSLANVKARIRRGKEMLKENFQTCCKFNLDKNGKLVGEPNCASCNQILRPV